jgi:hypothetical protein
LKLEQEFYETEHTLYEKAKREFESDESYYKIELKKLEEIENEIDRKQKIKQDRI